VVFSNFASFFYIFLLNFSEIYSKKYEIFVIIHADTVTIALVFI
jgi:hypothetical protein